MTRFDSKRGFVPIVWVLAILGIAFASTWAVVQGAAGSIVFQVFAAPLEVSFEAGAFLYRVTGAAFSSLRIPLLLVAAVWIARLVSKPREARRWQPVAASLLLGCVAQSFLIAGDVAFGIALYAGCVAVAALPHEPAPQQREPRLSAEILAVSICLAVFLVIGLYRINDYPRLEFDEVAYLRAARMFASQIEVGPFWSGIWLNELYEYDQFVAQTVPLAFQAAAVSVFPSDVIATRVSSIIAMAFALVVAYLALRRSAGPEAVSWMLALSCVAPLYLLYARSGEYMAISVLHSVVAFAGIVWLWHRWNVFSAAVVGLWLGASLFHYQLSWFVPVFTALALVSTPELWRRPRARPVLAALALSSGILALVGLASFTAGFERVGAQTFDRAFWTDAPGPGAEGSPGSPGAIIAVAPATLEAPEIEALVRSWADSDVSTSQDVTRRGERFMLVGGETSNIAAVAAELDRGGWLTLGPERPPRNPFGRLGRMLAQLFYAPDLVLRALRWNTVALLHPLLAPLLIIGLVLTWQRRREFSMRLVLIWVVCGALLPAVAGSCAPRRVLLMLPFAYLVMALPLVELRAWLPQRVRGVGTLVSLLLILALGSTQGFLYFREWNQYQGVPGGGGSVLQLLQLLKTWPADEPVLLTQRYPQFARLPDHDAHPALRVWPPIRMPPPQMTERWLRGTSCKAEPPFRWVTRNLPRDRKHVTWVEEHLSPEREVTRGFVVLRVEQVPEGLCPDRRGSRRAAPGAEERRPRRVR